MTDKHCKLKGEHYGNNCTHTYIHTYVRDSPASIKQTGLIEWTWQNYS